jgi:hypothetical protein
VQDKMFNEKGCLENLKHIVSECAEDENIKKLSWDELQSSYTKIANNIYPISISNRLKYKNMLWNIENLKPEIRSRFQTELLNILHSIYIKSAKAGPTEYRPKIKTQDSTFVADTEKNPEVDAKELSPIITEQQPIGSEKQESVASSENTDLSRDVKPVEKQSPITAPKATVHKYENDWFDKILDFFAAIVGGVAGIVGY